MKVKDTSDIFWIMVCKIYSAGMGLDPWLNLEHTDLPENEFLLYAQSYLLMSLPKHTR